MPHIVSFIILVFWTNSSINQLFIFGMVCVKSNLCGMGAGRTRNPLQPRRRKRRNVTPRGQWSPLQGYRGSCTRAGPGSQVSGLARWALRWRPPAQASICKAVEGDPRGASLNFPGQTQVLNTTSLPLILLPLLNSAVPNPRP